jgi:hypothetical protein
MTEKARLSPRLPSARNFRNPSSDQRFHAKENQLFRHLRQSEIAGFSPARRHAVVRRRASDGETWISHPAAASNSRRAFHAGGQRSRYYDDPVHRTVGSPSVRRNRSKRTCRAGWDGSHQCLGCRTPSFGTRICHGARQSGTRPQAPDSTHPRRRFFSENGGSVCATRTGTHRFSAGAAGSKSLCRPVAASRAGAECPGPVSASSEVGMPPRADISPAIPRRWSGP